MSHPDIKDCAVVGVSDKLCGEVPKAFIVPDNDKLTPEIVKSFLKGQTILYEKKQFL